MILPCFIINVALAQKVKPTTTIGLANHKTVALVLSADADEEETSCFLTDVLHEYLEFIGELPKAKKYKFSFVQSFKLSQFVSAIEPEAPFVPQAFTAEEDALIGYQPQGFFRSDYYNYLFRLTPF